MSRTRYWLAIILSIIVFISSFIVFSFEEFWFKLLIGYIGGSYVGELIFFNESFACRAMFFFLKLLGTVFVFWISFFGSGTILMFVIGIMLTSPLFAVMGGLASIGLGSFGVLAPIMYPYHIFTLKDEIW